MWPTQGPRLPLSSFGKLPLLPSIHSHRRRHRQTGPVRIGLPAVPFLLALLLSSSSSAQVPSSPVSHPDTPPLAGPLTLCWWWLQWWLLPASFLLICELLFCFRCLLPAAFRLIIFCFGRFCCFCCFRFSVFGLVFCVFWLLFRHVCISFHLISYGDCTGRKVFRRNTKKWYRYIIFSNVSLTKMKRNKT